MFGFFKRRRVSDIAANQEDEGRASVRMLAVGPGDDLVVSMSNDRPIDAVAYLEDMQARFPGTRIHLLYGLPGVSVQAHCPDCKIHKTWEDRAELGADSDKPVIVLTRATPWETFAVSVPGKVKPPAL